MQAFSSILVLTVSFLRLAPWGEYSCRNYDSVCTKVNLKSDFHIAGQLMETYRNNHGASCSSCSSDILSFGRCDKICQIFIGIQIIRFCHFNHSVYNSTGSGSFWTGTEQPVLPDNSKWSDCILAEIVR